MNWDVVGAVAELIGAVAVVISLLYLAIQIRAQTRESRLEATRDLARDYRELLRWVGTDDKTFSVYIAAIRDYGNLAYEDRVKAHLIFSQFLRVVELQYLHWKQGTLDSSFFNVFNRRIQETGALPGLRRYWENNKQDYDPDFVAHFEKHAPQKSET